MRTTRRRVLGQTRVAALTAAILVTACVGTALAAGNSVHAKPPKNVKVNANYKIKIHGSAPNGGQLYLFIDYHKCGASPAAEYARTGNGGSAYGLYWASVHGTFSRSGGFSSHVVGQDHACVYLTNASAPKNGTTGILAHSFKGYKIHH